MASQVSLSVNDVPINLDYFVSEYMEHVVAGIVGSLRDTGEIESLELSIGNDGEVKIYLNKADVPIKYFPNEIIRSTILGMVSTLKGVDKVERLQITIGR